MKQTISIIVSGRVQGVFYRQSTVEQALHLLVSGTVKNLPDGRVEVVATGTMQQLEALKAWCRQGPPRAVVTGIEVRELAFREYEGFSALR